MMPGKLIVLEGIDGSGTTTQAARLGEFLEGIGQPVLVTREPSHGPIGLELRRILGGAHAPVDPAAMALLFAADRVDHLSREILPALAQGRHVLTDRYLLSSLAYQSIVVDRELVVSFNARARRADLTLLLDVPVPVAVERRRARGGAEELYDAVAFQEKVAANYRNEAELLWQAGDAVLVIDGTPDPDTVFMALADAVKTCVLPGRNPS